MDWSAAWQKAEALLQSSKWGSIMTLLEPLVAINDPDTMRISAAERRAAHQALAVAHVMSYGSKGDWPRVLRLNEDGTVVEAKRQFRRLSLLIHPDQCLLNGASEAFVLLSEAQRQFLKRRAEAGEGSRNVRPRTDMDEGKDEEEGGDLHDFHAEEGYEWWSDWNGEKRLDESSCSASYLSELSKLSLIDLRERVHQLQQQLLAPSDRSLTLEERKLRLRAARSMLSEALAKDKA